MPKKENPTGNPFFYPGANLFVKVGATSLIVSGATQVPLALQVWTLGGANAPISKSALFSAATFRAAFNGFSSHAWTGQKRGFMSVTFKDKSANDPAKIDEEPRQKIGAVLSFAVADAGLTTASSNQAVLKRAQIITKTNFQWCPQNFYFLTKATLGSNLLATIANFAFLGPIGERVGSFYSFSNSAINQLAGGATAGMLAATLTTHFSLYSNKKLLGTTVPEPTRVSPLSCHSMFKQVDSAVKSMGMRRALAEYWSSYFTQLAIKAPTTGVVFGLIFMLDSIMGPEPLKSVWKQQNSEIDCESSSQSPK